MNKKLILAFIIAAVIAVLVGVVLVIKKRSYQPPTVTQEEKVELPINTIPVEERPFITLTPDASGHNLDLSVSGVQAEDPLEYEILYNTVDSQEGALGAVNVSSGEGPFVKTVLLGTRSAGGATTYHQGVTGGSLDVTYNDLRLKEQFNFLHFKADELEYSSPDVRFTVTLDKAALKDDSVVVVMKSFGLPAKLEGKLVAGPYAYTTPVAIKGSVRVSIKLPAGTYENAAIYSYDQGKWVELKTELLGEDTVQATTKVGNVFVVATPAAE